MYYVAESQLRLVGFDGTAFTGSAITLSALDPTWTAMSLIFAADTTPTPVPEPASLALVSLGLAGLGLRRRSRAT